MSRAVAAPTRRSRAWLGALAAATLFVAARGPGDGGSSWTPALAPAGPVLVLVGLEEQRALVYRNGVRIGSAPVSTGRPGFETPVGVYTILEKRREHTSNLYDDTPMPYMQRLTWDGLALHAGTVTGRPASHGCVRLPLRFAEQLFEVTAPGTPVVVAPRLAAPPAPGTPGLASGDPAAPADYAWTPARAPDGPVSLVLGLRERVLVVLRQGTEIGRARVRLAAPPEPGTRAFQLLADPGAHPAGLASARWLAITMSGDAPAPGAPDRFRIHPGFALHLQGVLAPGTVLVVTGEPLDAVLAPGTLQLSASGAGGD